VVAVTELHSADIGGMTREAGRMFESVSAVVCTWYGEVMLEWSLSCT
jgi:hypothetical protein